MEAQSESIKNNENVLIADDLLATGGTAMAAAKLVEEIGGNVVGFAFIVELSSLGRRKIVTRQRISCSLNGDLLI